MRVCIYVGASEVLPERSRETQRASQSLREAQRGPERPREAQRGPERYVCMYVGTYVCKDCEPFQKAKSYCSTQLHLQGRVEQIVHLESCTNVGLKGWSRNLRNVKLCFEDLQDYQGQPFVIASARGIKAVGIGIRKDKYERAADDLQLLCREPWRQHS